MKKFFLLAMGVICLQACKNNTTDTAKEAKTPSEMVENTATKSQKEEGGATEISDISIYNLPDTWTTQTVEGFPRECPGGGDDLYLL